MRREVIWLKRYEQIRQMNIDALANLLTSGGNCDFCNKKLYDYCRASRNGVPCGKVARKWLRNEVDSN